MIPSKMLHLHALAAGILWRQISHKLNLEVTGGEKHENPKLGIPITSPRIIAPEARNQVPSAI